MDTGDIVHHFCLFTTPEPKWKFLICIDPDRGLFLWINSKPSTLKPEANVSVSEDELSFLAYQSYIDTSALRHVDPDDISYDGSGKPDEYKGTLGPEVRARILDNLENNPHMAEAWKILIREKL